MLSTTVPHMWEAVSVVVIVVFFIVVVFVVIVAVFSLYLHQDFHVVHHDTTSAGDLPTSGVEAQTQRTASGTRRSCLLILLIAVLR